MVSDNIKAERARARLTQEELCEKSGLKLQTLRNYETNRNEPPISAVVKIAMALDISITDLVRE